MFQSVLDTLPWWQLLLIGLCFLWSGFVRSGLGFGGAALTLPLLLMFENNPLVFLPAISCHLLFFSALTVVTRFHNIDWAFLIKILMALAVPFAMGLVGLLNLSGELLTLIIYAITLVYGVGYIVNMAISSSGRLADAMLIFFGGYASGVSLIGAPLISAVGVRYLKPANMRDTLFMLWLVMVVLKIGTFVAAEVNLQWRLTLLTFPAVAVGHFLGLRMHALIVGGDKRRFEQFIGFGLVAISLLGLLNVLSRFL